MNKSMNLSLRVVAAVAVLVSAFVHLRLWLDGVKDEHVVGPAFLVNVVAGVAIAVLLLAWRSWEPPFLAAGFGAATIVAFVISATVGLFGVHEQWTGPYVWTAFVAEVVAIVAGLGALAGANGRLPRYKQHAAGYHA
jgi:small basic protein